MGLLLLLLFLWPMQHKEGIRIVTCAVQCYSCNTFGHIAWDCTKKYYNYCKKRVHRISVYPIRPERKYITAFHVSTGVYGSATYPAALQVVPTPAFATLANLTTLIPNMVREMINYALPI